MDKIECPGRRNFLGLSEEYSSPDRSLFHIVPVPYDASSTYIAGSRSGPRAILDASANIELYDHQLDFEPARAGVATLSELPVLVGDPVRMIESIESAVDAVLSKARLPIVLGGEHTVSLGAVKALTSRSKFTLVCLDAHADLRSEYQGSAYSHACYLRRASELVDCCAFGVRSMSFEESKYAREVGLRMFFADRIIDAGIRGADLGFLPESIYLSIDLDVFDPSIMPSTGTPEPGGLGWYQVTGLLEEVIKGRKILGFDIVELCPQIGNPAADFTAAKLLYKVMGLILKFSKNGRGEVAYHGKEKVQEESAP